MERQRDKTIESAGLILQLAQSNQVIHAFFQGLDMTVKHRRIRADTHVMNGPRHFQPSRSGNLVARNQRPRTLGKDFGAAARTASQPRFAQLLDNPFKWLSCDLCEEVQLDHRESLQMDGGKALLQSAQQIKIIVKWQIRVQAANDVKLCQ